MNPDEIERLMEAAKPSIIESLKQELTKHISWDVKNAAAKLIGDHITQWIKDNVIPDVTEQLVAGKNGFLAIAGTLGPAIVEEVVKSMTLALSEKMKSSWERKKIFEAMFA